MLLGLVWGWMFWVLHSVLVCSISLSTEGDRVTWYVVFGDKIEDEMNVTAQCFHYDNPQKITNHIAEDGKG